MNGRDDPTQNLEFHGKESLLEDNHKWTKLKKNQQDGLMLRKCPIALKGGFKSSYIRFFMTKQPVIKEELGGNTTVMDWNQGHPVLVWVDMTFIMLKRSLIAPLNTI